ncbi:23S rRNA (uracil(1939)-C(5))-methyltransferase RlmD [Burkholderiales bacterium]|nr:23S rRNA (uracil(1939)-C(5))-methyltransferase RlmD [Burkholderiales bacterium]
MPTTRSARLGREPSAKPQPQIAEIESLDLEGRGVARLEGKVAFIDGALPGERVLWQRTRSKARFDTGRVLQVLRASSLRVAPLCPHFGLEQGSCGGCSMQHLDARAQVSIKQRMLEETLWRIGHVRPEMVLRPVCGLTWHYRHRARLTARYVEGKGGALVGFHERASSYVADMRQCLVLPASVSSLLMPLRALLGELSIRDRLPQIEVAVSQDSTVLVLRILAPLSEADRQLLTEFSRQHGVWLWIQTHGPDSAEALIAGSGEHLTLALPEFGLSLPFRPTDFTQVNHATNEILVRRAVALLAPLAGEVVADFFCGMGNFALPLATRARQVVGLEGSASLLNRARAAAGAAGLAHKTTFSNHNLFEWSAQDWGALRRSVGGVIDCVLIDPPRDGALAVVQSLALTAPPRRLAYVSCNPATLARDCGWLVHQGNWALRAAGVINMFPHTSHVESIAVLEPMA